MHFTSRTLPSLASAPTIRRPLYVSSHYQLYRMRYDGHYGTPLCFVCGPEASDCPLHPITRRVGRSLAAKLNAPSGHPAVRVQCSDIPTSCNYAHLRCIGRLYEWRDGVKTGRCMGGWDSPQRRQRSTVEFVYTLYEAWI